MGVGEWCAQGIEHMRKLPLGRSALPLRLLDGLLLLLAPVSYVLIRTSDNAETYHTHTFRSTVGVDIEC